MLRSRPIATALLFLLPILAVAQDAAVTPVNTIDKGDSVWVALSSVLVLLMTPGLALFYGGMVRRKNVLSTMLHSYIMLGIVSIIWLVAGYSLAFGHSSNGFLGGFEWLGGSGISMTAPHPGFDPPMTVPNGLFMIFQMMFAIITPALISGAIAERMKFSGYVLFSILWSLVVYAPVACWVWNPGGWLFHKGALDFAGGTVVHLASGVAALAAAIVLGKRKAVVKKEPILPNNLTLTVLGAGILWVGWIGFNAGSALAMNDVAINAFLTTHLAAAAGMLGWLVCEKLHVGKPTVLGAASGLVGGLVGITPAAGFVTPISAILIGLIVGAACCFAVTWKTKMGYDDALDVVGVHGVGGALGAVLTGILASEAANPAVKAALDANGGRGGLILTQIIGVVAVGAFSFIMSFILLKVCAAVTGLRVDDEHEEMGLDLALHGESGYNLSGS